MAVFWVSMDGKLDQLAPVPVVMCGLCEAGTTPAIQAVPLTADAAAKPTNSPARTLSIDTNRPSLLMMRR